MESLTELLRYLEMEGQPPTVSFLSHDSDGVGEPVTLEAIACDESGLVLRLRGGGEAVATSERLQLPLAITTVDNVVSDLEDSVYYETHPTLPDQG